MLENKEYIFNGNSMTEQDILRRFLFEELGVRGEWVNLTASWQAAKQHQHGSAVVQQLLGQALVAVVMLSATIKFKGSMILQAQGDGAITTLVAQSTDERKIRGLVRSSGEVTAGSLESMFGQGRLVLTIDSGNAKPYQGIVPLQGEQLATALESYFEQSEQLNTRLWLFANHTQAAGLLLQELPTQDSEEDGWQRIEMLANTITEKELLELDCEQLLYRLFHDEKVRLFDAEAVEFQCACSRQKIEQTLRAMGKQELEDILKERGGIEVICEFCSEHYHFDKIDVETFLLEESVANDSATLH
ncbi:MAG: molecular chaperone Hsp33 [Methylococcaceae bacterium NSP1-2]|nr:MAG: molecular chaperone Hsp33 [Methylococcaceae bacterium NSP1-2]